MSRSAGLGAGRVGVLIVNYHSEGWLRRALDALSGSGASMPPVSVFDNGSSPGALRDLGASVQILGCGRNLGFAAGINRARRAVRTEFLLLLNPDCLITPEGIERLVAELDRHPEAALVSGRVVGTDGAEQRGSRRRLPQPALIIGEMLGNSSKCIDLSQTPPPSGAVELEAVSGACMLVRAAVFDALGGLDEGYRLHFEDLDFMARIRQAGWTIHWVGEVQIVHAGGQSSRHRPLGVEIDKHFSLWRYLRRHCHEQWPWWQRPLWALALLAHLGWRLVTRLPAAIGSPRHRTAS